MRLARIQTFDRTVVAGDSLGTCASFPSEARLPYNNNGDTAAELGNESYTMDPPGLTAQNDISVSPFHNGADPRHTRRANVLFADSHCEPLTLERLGYAISSAGAYEFIGPADNGRFHTMLFSGTGVDADRLRSREPEERQRSPVLTRSDGSLHRHARDEVRRCQRGGR